jgi:CRP-like cAMP-binding protein
MSHALRSRPAKRSKSLEAASEALFNPATFLETAARGRLVSTPEKRLARLLLLLANFGKEGRAEPILARISQETLAEMIGTTRSRVSHFMNKFRQLGFIEYNGHLEVHNSLVSVLLADQPRTVSPPE